MENQRNILLIALAFVCFALWSAWIKDHAYTEQTGNQVTTTSESLIPSTSVTNKLAPATQIAPPATKQPITKTKQQQINVKTDVLDVNIDTLGGDIVSVSLPKYPTS